MSLPYGTRVLPFSPDYPVGAERYIGGYVVGIGPAAPTYTICSCGRPARVQCRACYVNLCGRCWWRHCHGKTGQ